MEITTREFLDQLRVRLADALNETEVRDRFCGEIYATSGITFRLERGRSDARLNRVIMEFKNKGLFGGRTNSAKFQEAFQQLTEKYIPEQAEAEGIPSHEYIGIAIDGEHYAFVFLESDGQGRHTQLLPINEESVDPLIDAIATDLRRAFTAENILEDFGSESSVAKAVIRELWTHLYSSTSSDTGNNKILMLYQEWQRLFAQAANLGKLGRQRMDEYLLAIGLEGSLDYTGALFVLHTYNALLFKLLAAEVVTSFRYQVYSGFASQAAGSADNDLLELLDRRIEHSELFRAHGIENFIEGTFFTWYLEECPRSLVSAIRKLLIRLGLYTFPSRGTGRVTDVVKAIYQDLVPTALRKNIGEFYTPEWLVDFVLDQVGYHGDAVLEGKLLDPCCGSGNFLIHAIARLRERARGNELTGQDLANKIINNIFGLDLNPLAVISARLNYLLAIVDTLSSSSRIEIPVYLADAVYAPELELREGNPIRYYQIGTVLGNIELALPESLVRRRTCFGQTLSIMEMDIENQADRDMFLDHIEEHPDLKQILENNPKWKNYLGDMFDRISYMELKNWNKVWCRIVRNYFSSAAIGKMKWIVGNPPWVRWSELPEDYRELIRPTCTRYDIFSSTPFFGGNELDISGMIAYTVADKWLADEGTMGFIITQVHFQAPSSEGFRAFKLPDGTHLGVGAVHDFTKARPFHGPTNKPAVFTWKRGKETAYPVDYTEWTKVGRGKIPEDATPREAADQLEAIEKHAYPIPPDQRWSVLEPERAHLIPKLSGGSVAWRGRKGIVTDLNGAYFVEILGPGATPGSVKIRTQPESGRKPVPLLDHDIEEDLIFPLLKGARQISAFSYSSIGLGAIVPNQRISGFESEDVFKRKYPLAFKYFQRVNSVLANNNVPLLESRSTWRSRMQATGAPIYAIYDVGPYTFSHYKVVWAEIAGSLAAAVVAQQELHFVTEKKPIVPDHKVYFVSTDDEDAAHFLCALLNSEPIRTFVDSFTIKLQVGTIFRLLRIPGYNPSDERQRRLSTISKLAHKHGVEHSHKEEINRLAWELVGEW